MAEDKFSGDLLTASGTKKLEHFLAVGRSVESSAAAMELIRTATAEPGMIAFQELIELPAVQALQKSEDAQCAAMFRLLLVFAYGTWSSYRKDQASLPPLSPPHELKLKQLSVITLAESTKVLPYETLMRELELKDVRALEDFLINSCIYTGAITGKLDQKQRYLEVDNAMGRDLRPGQLDEVIAALAGWLDTTDGLLGAIHEKLQWAKGVRDAKQAHKKELEGRIDNVKKNIRTELELRGQQDSMMADQSPGPSAMDEDRVVTTTRSKRRR